MADKKPILEVKDAVVRFKRPGQGDLFAVNNVSFELFAGEVVGLVGESGCGKSTLARSICGLQKLHSGEIIYQGQTVRPLGLRPRPRHELGIQMVFQNPYSSLNPRRSIGDQIEDGRRIYTGKNEPHSVDELLTSVQLSLEDAHKYPHQFSGGQRQRAAIAKAVASSPDVLIGDEPIASLDASMQIHVAELMGDLAKETGAALLFITHDLAIVRQICDRIIVMNAGQIVEQGSAEGIWDHPEQEYTRKLLASIPIADGEGRIPGFVQ